MAAAEYYNPGGMSQGPPPGAQSAPRPPNLAPPPNGPPPNAQQPPYPMSDAPPPYSAFGNQQRPHSQPPPQGRIPQQNYQPYNPNPPQNVDTHQYPPEKMPQRPTTLQNMYRPSDFTSSHPPPPGPAPQNAYGPTPVAPGLSQVYPNGRRPSSFPPGQYPPSRSRSSSRERRKHHHKPRPDLPRKKSSGVNTFLGAGGGAIIGDLIFPGLGTLGGAILGGVGGHEYGKKRAQSNPSRTYRRSNSNHREYYDDDYQRGRKY